MTTKFLLHFFTLLFLTTASINARATVWETAYPYTQHITGQQIIIKAVPYAPRTGSPMPGSTDVYYGDKLLYRIAHYYREPVYTSNDGQYLAVVHTTNTTGISDPAADTAAIPMLLYNQPAIEIYKDGLPFRMVMLHDILDTSRLTLHGGYFSWSYYVDTETITKAGYRCDACRDVYGKKVLDNHDTAEIDNEEWLACTSACDSVANEPYEAKIAARAVYVLDDTLFLLTNQGTAVSLAFNNLSVQVQPFSSAVADKKKFNPPALVSKYKEVTYPDEFAVPPLADGSLLSQAIAGLYGKQVAGIDDSAAFCVFIDNMVIDRDGRCTGFSGLVYDKRIAADFSKESVNTEMTEQLDSWIRQQTFDTNLIPPDFDGFSFLSIVNLK